MRTCLPYWLNMSTCYWRGAAALTVNSAPALNHWVTPLDHFISELNQNKTLGKRLRKLSPQCRTNELSGNANTQEYYTLPSEQYWSALKRKAAAEAEEWWYREEQGSSVSSSPAASPRRRPSSPGCRAAELPAGSTQPHTSSSTRRQTCWDQMLCNITLTQPGTVQGLLLCCVLCAPHPCVL